MSAVPAEVVDAKTSVICFVATLVSFARGPLPPTSVKKHHTLLTGVTGRFATSTERDGFRCLAQRGEAPRIRSQSLKTHRQIFGLVLAYPTCDLLSLQMSRLCYDAQPIQTVQARFGYCHRALAAHPSCLTGTQVENELLDAQLVPSFFPPAARGGTQILGNFSSMFDCAPSVGTGMHSAIKGQRVCNPLS